MEILSKDFQGVFYFTNPTDENFTHLWNNEEYIYPKMSTCPMIFPKETSENVQEIRKRFAFDLAVREFYAGRIKTSDGRTYDKMAKMGNGLPPTFDERILEPMIEKCLNPLPIAKAVVRESKKSKENFKGSRAVGNNDNLNETFKDEPVKTLGKMSDNA